MSTLTKSELLAAETILAKKYKGVVRGSLTNTQKRGRFANKRTIKVVCPHCKGKAMTTSTQELFHLVCEHCGESTQKKVAK